MTERNWRLNAISLLALVVLLAGCAGAGTTQDTTGSATPEPGRSLPALGTLPRNSDGYADVSVQQLAGSLPDKNYTLVNVHVPYEGELPETDLFIPYDQIQERAQELPGKDAPIVLYCRSGAMSTTAAKTLVQLGYTNVMELEGGMVAWEQAGHQLEFR
jgi:rhodanese-related sulfurtransferase